MSKISQNITPHLIVDKSIINNKLFDMPLSEHAYNIIIAALITVVHKPSLFPSADCVKLCVL